MEIRLHESEKDNFIAIYRGNKRVGKYKRTTEPQIEGYIVLPYSYELTIPRNKVEHSFRIEKCL